MAHDRGPFKPISIESYSFLQELHWYLATSDIFDKLLILGLSYIVIGPAKLLALLFPIWIWQLFNVIWVDWYGCNKRESIYWLAHIKTIPVHSTSQHNIPQLRYLNNDSLLESLEVSNLGLSNSLKASNTRSRKSIYDRIFTS